MFEKQYYEEGYYFNIYIERVCEHLTKFNRRPIPYNQLKKTLDVFLDKGGAENIEKVLIIPCECDRFMTKELRVDEVERD